MSIDEMLGEIRSLPNGQLQRISRIALQLVGSRRSTFLLVGSRDVGRTSISIEYNDATAPRDYVPTIFDNHINSLASSHVILGAWDTAGQEDYSQFRWIHRVQNSSPPVSDPWDWVPNVTKSNVVYNENTYKHKAHQGKDNRYLIPQVQIVWARRSN